MITEEHVRDLLRPRADEPTLVVVRGRAQVIPATELDRGDYRGAIEVVSAKELVRRIGTRTPSDQDITALASTLNTTVAELGS
ncbi:hypothetical protein [Streptomyces sp. ISL-100]|uniref:hypothetical protein n=1 Tax=Streptomyces sp. ISL-100 TaxID=2819173 RepID=UPI001BEC9D88|nr:hypothetical protein [Streptomyces sp. ISL-100]MBT2394955.1 hypothetical protein [Streptomyces sp. ISL-100]